MTRIISHRGVSWISPPVKHVPPKQREHEEIGIACRRCVISRSRYPSMKAAFADGWRKIEVYAWRTEPHSNHRGLCPSCRTHPEEENRITDRMDKGLH